MKVAVIGAGTMGSGIAQAFAQTEGYEVILTDIDLEFAQKGQQRIAKALQSRVDKGKMEQAAVDQINGRIRAGLLEDCGDCDLIVEAVLEEIAVKKESFKTLDAVAKPECVFASNTSSLSITEIARGLTHPLVGMHFFNPAPIMKLVEVIPGLSTPPEVVKQVIDIAISLGKTPVEGKGIGWVCGQSYFGSNDQRGCRHPGRRRCQCRRHRHCYEAGSQSSHGSPGIGRPDRVGCLPGNHGGLV